MFVYVILTSTLTTALYGYQRKIKNLNSPLGGLLHHPLVVTTAPSGGRGPLRMRGSSFNSG